MAVSRCRSSSAIILSLAVRALVALSAPALTTVVVVKKSAMPQSRCGASAASVRTLGIVLPRSKFEMVSTDFLTKRARSACDRPAASRRSLIRCPNWVSSLAAIIAKLMQSFGFEH